MMVIDKNYYSRLMTYKNNLLLENKKSINLITSLRMLRMKPLKLNLLLMNTETIQLFMHHKEFIKLITVVELSIQLITIINQVNQLKSLEEK